MKTEAPKEETTANLDIIHSEMRSAIRGLRYIQRTMVSDEADLDSHIAQACIAMGVILGHIEEVVAAV